METNIKKIAMTGATGIIGIAFVNQCIKEGVEVYAFCRRNSKRSSRVPRHPLVHVVECNLNELLCFDKKQIPTCDVFCHLGWEGTVGEARNDMTLQLKNVKTTLEAVELAYRLGCRIFLGVGSQAEYGRSFGDLSGQTPVFPENGYGMAKLCAGQMSREECKRRGLKHIWARVFSVYGPYDNEMSMIAQTIRKILMGEKPRFTKGEQYWDYLYCADAARALFLLCKKGREKVYCIGSGKPRRLIEYINIIREQTNPGIELGVGEIPYSENQIMYLSADIRELQEDTGFCPQVGFEEGIKSTISWIKSENMILE